MIIIPELKKIVILVPRTASGSLRRTLAATYPKSFMLYRHMEADGVPHGYNFWEKVGIVRHPLDRLWSLYKFLQNPPEKLNSKFAKAQKISSELSFNSWILSNSLAFSGAFQVAEEIHPDMSSNYAIPETRKSQFIYLRPDLGTKIFQYQALDDLADYLNIKISLQENKTEENKTPNINGAAMAHMNQYFEWDYKACQ